MAIAGTFALLIAAPGWADDLVWRFIGGPPHGHINTVVPAPSHPDILYAGGPYGEIFRSADGGATWIRRSIGDLTEGITGLAVDPTDPDRLLVALGNQAEGVFLWLSADGGATWIPAEKGNQFDAGTVFFAANDPDVIYTDQHISRDGGTTWGQYEFPNRRTRLLKFHPTDPNTLYWSRGADLWKSIDGGLSWDTILTPNISAMIFDQANPWVIYAASRGFGIHRSADGGATWTTTTQELTYTNSRGNTLIHEFTSIAQDPNELRRLYAGASTPRNPGGLFVSTDRGATWRSSGQALGELAGHDRIERLLVRPDKAILIQLSSFDRVSNGPLLRSADQGRSWHFWGQGMDQGEITGYNVEADGRLVIFGRNAQGTYRSLDRGLTWQRPSLEEPDDVVILMSRANGGERPSLAHREFPQVQVAITDRRPIEYTRDGGRTWDILGRHFPAADVNELFFDPDDPNQLYAATQAGLYGLHFGDELVPVPPPQDSFETRPPQGNWTYIEPTQSLFALALDALDRVWFAGNRIGVVEEGEPRYIDSENNPHQDVELAVDAEGRLLFSRDLSRFDGQNWEEMDPDIVHFFASQGNGAFISSLLPRANGEVWFGTEDYYTGDGGLFRWVDGQAQRQTEAPLINGTNINVIVEDRAGRLWIGTGAPRKGDGGADDYQGGLSVFDGQTWKSYTQHDGIGHPFVRDIALGTEGKLWLATGKGITCFDPDLGVGRNYSSDNSALVDDRTTAVAVDSSGAVWAATESGLSRFDGSYWTNYRESDGLANEQVNDILVDGQQRLWCATPAGLSMLEYYAPTAIIEAVDGISQDSRLGVNYPNPFNGRTEIPFTLAHPSSVKLSLFNTAGQQVAILANAKYPAGHYRTHWDGRNARGQPLASGVYLYRLQMGNQVQTRHLLLLR